MASKRDYYNKLFENYPDVVNTKQFREMLGGVNEKTVLYLLRRDQVKHFRIRNAYGERPIKQKAETRHSLRLVSFGSKRPCLPSFVRAPGANSLSFSQSHFKDLGIIITTDYLRVLFSNRNIESPSL